jgi:hypothetical protein
MTDAVEYLRAELARHGVTMGEEVTLEDVQRVRLEPGDVVVVRVNDWPVRACQELGDYLAKHVFPDNVVAVIPVESVSIVRPAPRQSEDQIDVE